VLTAVVEIASLNGQIAGERPRNPERVRSDIEEARPRVRASPPSRARSALRRLWTAMHDRGARDWLIFALGGEARFAGRGKRD